MSKIPETLLMHCFCGLIRYPPYSKTALSMFKAAAKLPPIPPVRTLLQHVCVLGAVVVGLIYSHKSGLLTEALKFLHR